MFHSFHFKKIGALRETFIVDSCKIYFCFYFLYVKGLFLPVRGTNNDSMAISRISLLLPSSDITIVGPSYDVVASSVEHQSKSHNNNICSYKIEIMNIL
jgi:hypothetical protein